MKLQFNPSIAMYDHSWCWADNRFSVEELDHIIEIGESTPKIIGATVSANSGKSLTTVRNSEIAWIPFTENTKWLYERIGIIVTEFNDQYYRFNLSGLSEDLQYTVYDANRGAEHYDWHIDTVGKGVVPRKLSLVLQLSDIDDYEGGDLILHGATKECMSKKRGYITMFPSYMLHKITPVTKGIRKSLVVWISGPQFI